MPFLDVPGYRLHYLVEGRPADKSLEPWLMFCNSLGTDLHMWDAQAHALARDFRVIRYDRRGHGLSSAPPAPFSIDDLGRDALALMDSRDMDKTHYCGLSIGGLVGQWLGIHARDRLETLVVAATAPKIGTSDGWAARIEAVRAGGLSPLLAATTERWFSPDFVRAQPHAVEKVLKSFAATAPDAYNGCCAALATADLLEELRRVKIPVLAISGDDDAVCPASDLQKIADVVQQGRHISLPGRHIINIESSAAFTAVLADFLNDSTLTL